MRTPDPEYDGGIAHAAVAVFSVLSMAFAAVAVTVALWHDGDGEVIAIGRAARRDG